jgi:hypothetical protein
VTGVASSRGLWSPSPLVVTARPARRTPAAVPVLGGVLGWWVGPPPRRSSWPPPGLLRLRVWAAWVATWLPTDSSSTTSASASSRPPVLAEGALDRLVNSPHHVLMPGRSYRPLRRPDREATKLPLDSRVPSSPHTPPEHEGGQGFAEGVGVCHNHLSAARPGAG